MANLKELTKRPELLSGGHRLCAGCGAGIIARQVMMAAADKPVVVANATGCLEVSTTIYPFSAWKTSWFHSAFENAAASCSGIEAAYKALKEQEKWTKIYALLLLAEMAALMISDYSHYQELWNAGIGCYMYAIIMKPI